MVYLSERRYITTDTELEREHEHEIKKSAGISANVRRGIEVPDHSGDFRQVRGVSPNNLEGAPRRTNATAYGA